ncbi:DUF3806 domain-containing protein [Spongiibacter sp. KMU-158]|uniref:DUF3806 domain-containing protein n=1 Tax=Spongiibacter pelagi TaxID=2760804 RepID=A0A927C1Y3_9GAMM|nr:DUF3806 domain-containing protein [Spongiibacter pelagi]MBD2858306.1 DUF3806 domain-containing protein [Spongiibacter pelagi]
MNHRLLKLFLLCLLPLAGNMALADKWRTDPITPLDRGYMESTQRELNELVQIKLGRSFGHGRDQDLQLIQEVLDRKLVRSDDMRLLQGMGIMLGDYLRKENGLKWVIYSDKIGRSRALEVPTKDQFLFPVTQISNRVRVDADVDVKAIYQRLEEDVARIKKMIIIR